MSFLHNFLSKFHHTEDNVTLEAKQILQHVEDEFTALEKRVQAIEDATIGAQNNITAPTP